MAPSPTLSHIRTLMPVMIAAEASKDRNLGEAAAKLIMLKPPVGQFAGFNGGVRSLLNWGLGSHKSPHFPGDSYWPKSVDRS